MSEHQRRGKRQRDRGDSRLPGANQPEREDDEPWIDVLEAAMEGLQTSRPRER